MNNQNFYIDLHVIQTVPPSCVNRDDTGSPKTARYGGVIRARVSSQSWKRAMRGNFRSYFDEEKLGDLTKYLGEKIAKEICKLDASISDEDALSMGKDAFLKGLNFQKAKNKEKTSIPDALFFMGNKQAKELAKLAIKKEKGKTQYGDALKKAPPVDAILFGRMVADEPDLNYDACAQVAHSISTHEVHNEFDFFSAIDDFSGKSAHISSSEFNSSTLYRYATVNVKELYGQLGEDTPAVVRGFAEAFICSMPTGKQNSFANRTLPDAVYVTVRRDQPINLVNAFEEPIRSDEGYAKKSAQKLAEYAQKIYKRYSAQPEQAFLMGDGLEKLGEEIPLPEILDKLEAAVREVQ